MSKNKLLNLLKLKLESQLKEDYLQCKTLLKNSPQYYKVQGSLNYEYYIINEIIKIIKSGYLKSLYDGLSVLSDNLTFSWQKKKFLQMYLNVAEQQTKRVFILLKDANIVIQNDSNKIPINHLSGNLLSITNLKFETLTFKPIDKIAILTLIISLIGTISTIFFGIMQLS